MPDQLVAVIWDDAHVEANEVLTRDEVRDRAAVEFASFGLLVRQDERMVCVAAEQCADGNYRGVTYVPKGLVKEIVPLGHWPKRKRVRKTPVIVTEDAG